MTIIFEVSKPFLKRPFYYKGPASYRIGWAYFAIAWLRVPYYEFVTTAYDWSFK